MNLHKLAMAVIAQCMLGAMGHAQAQPKVPPAYRAPMGDIAYLPKYCYKQYVDGSLTGPTYSIQNCGYAMNHFCPGLVDLVEASKISNPKNERVGHLKGAIENFQYTLREMPATCPIANDVRRAMSKARAMTATIR